MPNKEELEAAKRIDEAKAKYEVLQIAEAYTALQMQRANPTRVGMIEALQKAQSLASAEIQGEINQNGGYARSKPWTEFTTAELYSLLPIYQDGLIQLCKKKCSEKLLKELLSEYIQ